MKVSLRKRLKGEKISLYLDYYSQGKRKYEYLNLYLYPEPKEGKFTKEQREENRRNLALAETIKSKRHLEMVNGNYGFEEQSKMKANFIQYFQNLTEQKRESLGNYGNWDSTLKLLKNYVGSDIKFEQITRKWLEDLKEHLQKNLLKNNKELLSQNSQSSYFNKVRAALKQAHKEGIIKQNPADLVKGIPPSEHEREFLTYDELKILVKTECENSIIKRAFLFSALTGLRWSDIVKLTWQEVQYSKEMGHYIRFRQKKTKGIETLPISEEAFTLMGEKSNEENVFAGLKYSAWTNLKLQQWIMKAGISKSISFHCARHTYATLQLTLGTDIYTVSKLLGHKNLKTTQIYARVIDEKKIEAANKIQIL